MKVGFCRSDLPVAKASRASRRRFATRRSLLPLLMLAVSGTADAAEWVIVHTSPDGDRYAYDASKLAISGNEITYWKKVTFQSAQFYKGSQAASALYRERIHCADHTLKPLNHVIHAANGAVIELVSTEAEAAAIVPETVGDVFEQILCPLLKSRREEPQLKAPPENEKIEKPAPPAYNGEESRPFGVL